MLPTRHTLARTTSSEAHVCLSCRLRTQGRARHTSTIDTENTVDLHTLTGQGVKDETPLEQAPTPRSNRTVDVPTKDRPFRIAKTETDTPPIRKYVSERDPLNDLPPPAPSTGSVETKIETKTEPPRRFLLDGDGRNVWIRRHSGRPTTRHIKLHESRRDETPVDFEDVARPFPNVRRQWGTAGAVGVEEERERVKERVQEREVERLFEEHAMAAAGGGVVGGEVENARDGGLEGGRSASGVSYGNGRDENAAESYKATEIQVASQATVSRANHSKTPETTKRETSDGGDVNFLGGLRVTTATESSVDTPSTPSASPPLRSAQAGQNARFAWHQRWSAYRQTQARAYHTSRRRQQQHAAVEVESSSLPPDILPLPTKKLDNPQGIRAQLRSWQEMHPNEDRLLDTTNFTADPDTDFLTNNLTRLPDTTTAPRTTQAEQAEDEREAMAHFMQAPSDEPSSADITSRFLNMGDLVEIEYLRSDSPAMVAIFIRRVGNRGLAQLYTVQGRWVHVVERSLQYAIPGWVTEEMVQPLVPYLPDPDVVETKLEELNDEAYIRDLSVPREVAGPLVSRMVQFQAEAKEIYRRHAGTLDNAHNLLAHESDLRYGSLVSAATTLLRTPAEKLPVTALFAVRQALSNAGFAFNIDRRSHRLTGYLQIRSKEQVKMVEHVRGWLREWQDDLAITATLSEARRRKHKPKRGAVYVYSFLEKVKKIILKSREDRQPTEWGNIGPSQVRLPITRDKDCVRITTNEMFTEQDTELVRFMESWSLSQMFVGLPRIEALPPLLLQATGLYETHELQPKTGLVFLQEIGTILPYENRVRFDQHLLLPSSQHSKPLQNLMSSLLEMSTNHQFRDSMAGLRHDWCHLPVFCIDAASAHEIDDGISVEPAALATDGAKEWWVHVHIANPTAFFERDHALAKMARHMGESIYMPERTYMMLPRWATQRHFSLAGGRPCLTFSARVDERGEVLERKVRSGVVRNVVRLTQEEVAGLLGVGGRKGVEGGRPETVLTVGGEAPPERERRSQVKDVTPGMVEDLKTLIMLGERRQDVRKAAGGLFFDAHKPEINVWQSYKAPGLAWDHPFRKGWRKVEGDPVIQMKTRGLWNWFSPSHDRVDVLVREMMLLACETAATWCEARQIPAVFRGTMRRPGRMAPERYFEEVLAPSAAKSANGEYPMHLGVTYLETFGNTALATKPFNHRILGMDHYGKVTSPLRRYGDMILHWQIEAALREEARTGKSLVTEDPNADRRFLPFSAAALKTIIVGLQPRESLIMKAKMYAENFWISQLLFRMHHFGESGGLPNKTVRAYLHSVTGASYPEVGCILTDLNVTATMRKLGKNGGVGRGAVGRGGWEEVRQGDVWECEVEGVECYTRMIVLRAVRLVERVEEAWVAKDGRLAF